MDIAEATEYSFTTKEDTFEFTSDREGCVNVTHRLIDDSADYFHICDLDEFIEMLKEFQDMRGVHFMKTGNGI